MGTVSLYGGNGFIGSEFYRAHNIYHHNIVKVPRYSRRPESNSDILYMISTVHNYNVFEDPVKDVRTNLEVLCETLESWKNHSPNGTFNFVSSWFVYGDNGVVCSSENSPCNPKGFYSITKHCAEQLIISFCDTFSLNYRILRLGNVIGPGDKGVSAKKNALQYLIRKMQNGENIDVYEKGLFYRNYSHVSDIADALSLIVTHGSRNTIYNVGNKANYMFINMLDYVAEQLNYIGSFNFIEQKDFHKKVQVKSFRMDCSRLYDELGFQSRYGMTGMLDSVLKEG